MTLYLAGSDQTMQQEIAQIDQVYLKVQRIQGWLWPHACRVMAILDACQKQQGVSGNLFEIGVWHGKSAIVLASLLAKGESLGVCDLFDDTAASGKSLKLERFRQNIARFYGDAPFVREYRKSSRELTREEITPEARLIHIDGAHDSTNVYEDLVLAESCLHEQGAVIMDDAFQDRWPGVTDGIYHFLFRQQDRLVPLLSGFNKLVLVRPGAAAIFVKALADADVLKARFAGAGPYWYKIEEVMGHPTQVYFEQPPLQAAFCPELLTATYKRVPWLKNPLTRWVNQRLRALREK